MPKIIFQPLMIANPLGRLTVANPLGRLMEDRRLTDPCVIRGARMLC